MAWVLLGTDGCHLCDDAQRVILSLHGQLPVDVFVQDIIDNEQWLQRFAEKIPVLLDEESGAYLSWPFDAMSVLRWYQQLNAEK